MKGERKNRTWTGKRRGGEVSLSFAKKHKMHPFDCLIPSKKGGRRSESGESKLGGGGGGEHSASPREEIEKGPPPVAKKKGVNKLPKLR